VVDSACRKCGAPRPSGSSAGSLCPACLLDIALSETLSDAEDDLEADGIPPGTNFASFVVTRPLGRGGMGAVYEAFDTRLERSVALKVLPAEFLHDPTFARRFETEARLAARLEHPNIVPIYASGIEQGIPWMSMRLLAGQNLSVLLRERRLPAPEAVTLLRQVAAALDHAHALGVVHRDIKPANILLDRAGVASVADFGLAQLMDSGVRLTRTGMLSGTPHYMAPEQALGQRVDHRCDIYALGIVAYEMLVGRTPFGGDSPVAVLLQQVNAPLPAPAGANLPVRCMAAINKATAKDPAERWPSAGGFVDALGAAIAVAPPADEAQAQPVHSRRVPVGPLVLAAALLVIAAILWIVISPPEPKPDAAVAIVDERGGPQRTAEVPDPPPPSPPPPESEGQTSSAGKPGPAVEPDRNSSAKQEPPPGPEPKLDPDKETPAPVPPAPPPAVAVVEGPGGLASLPALPGVVPPTPPKDEFTPPKEATRAKHEYPPAARRAKLGGLVTLEGIVDVDGTVRDVRVVQSPHPVFDKPAMEAFLQYRYEPARLNGRPVKHRVTVEIKFVLDNN
jgi:TonB family protein